MLSHGLFIASNPKWEWESPPPSPPPWNMIGDEMEMTVLLVYLAPWAERSSDFRGLSCFELWFFNICSVKQPSSQFCLVLIGIGFCETVLMENKNHHNSSILRNLTTLPTPEWERVSCFDYLPWFCKVSLSSSMILLEFSFCWIWQW